MFRRARTACRSATCLLRGCQTQTIGWGLTEASARTPAAQRRCLFSSIEAIKENSSGKQKAEQDLLLDVTCPIKSFIQRYLKTNKKFPTIKLVVQETQAPRLTVKTVLADLKSNNSSKVTEASSSIAALFPIDTQSNQSLKDTDSLAEPFQKQYGVDAADKDCSEMLEGHKRKRSSMTKAAPMIEVLQQVKKHIRRVNLSPWKGLGKDLSWDDTLVSISPSPMDCTQDLVNQDISSSVSISPETSISADVIGSNQLTKSTETITDASSVVECQYIVKLVSTKRASVIASMRTKELLASLQALSPVFSCLDKRIGRVLQKSSPHHAILHFKTNEDMMKALELETVNIKGENLLLKKDGVWGEEESSNHEAHTVAQESTRKKPFAASAYEAWDFATLQRVICIDIYGTNVSFIKIGNFFNTFGLHQLCYEAVNKAIFIKFKKVTDKIKALNIIQFAIDDFRFKLTPDVSPSELVIRLVAKSVDADKGIALNAFPSYGSVNFIRCKKAGQLDAHYKPSEKARVCEILQGLQSDTNIKDSWFASVRCPGYEVFVEDTEICDVSQINTLAEDVKKLLQKSQDISNQLAELCSHIKSH